VDRAFRELKPSVRGEYEITDLIQWFIDNDHRVGFSVTKRWWKDIGIPEDLIELILHMLDEATPRIDGEVRGQVQGRVIVERGAVVEGIVHGPAYVGKGTHVARNAHVEHFVDLEAGVRLMEGSLSRSLVLDGAELRLGKARLTDSLIGPGSRVSLREGMYRLIMGEEGRVEGS
jgi:glucose-1-phosphate thymidylyltransferase